jgi:hypothetical protein
MASKKTAIVTGASQGIGAAVVRAFMDLGYNVVGSARSFSSGGFPLSPGLALVEGDIGLRTTAEKLAQTAIEKFGSIDHVVSNAGIFSSKPFTDYTADEFAPLSLPTSRVYFHHSTCGEADACASHRRQRDVYHGSARRQPDRGCSSLHSSDHQGRIGCGYPEPRERICEKQHPL